MKTKIERIKELESEAAVIDSLTKEEEPMKDWLLSTIHNKIKELESS